jgi:hypothetical protein
MGVHFAPLGSEDLLSADPLGSEDFHSGGPRGTPLMQI